ncbi:phloem protein 2-like protein [Tanacetum coccineum]
MVVVIAVVSTVTMFCLDAARGLNFLHNGNGKNDTLIHGNIKSSNILISSDGVGMIGDFVLSTNRNTQRLTKEYDVFSFGLVLYVVMSKDHLTHVELSKEDPELLPDLVKLCINQRKLNNIIDPMLQKKIEKDCASISTREDP